MSPVRASVRQVLGQAADADEDILEYIISVLEDDDFDYGTDGEGIFDSVGMMLVSCTSVAQACLCLPITRSATRHCIWPALAVGHIYSFRQWHL